MVRIRMRLTAISGTLSGFDDDEDDDIPLKVIVPGNLSCYDDYVDGVGDDDGDEDKANIVHGCATDLKMLIQ